MDTSMDSQPAANAGGEDDGSFYLPQNMLGGKTFKAGDKITLEVVGADDEGDVEVKLAADSTSEKPSFADDLKSSMAEPAQT
jgi:hypothetical protein